VSEPIRLEQAQAAVAAAFEQAEKDGRSIAAAVVDAHGDLICCARMDGTPERVLRFAIRKAYTAAVMGRDTAAFKREMQQAERTLADYGDPNFTTLQGGLVVRSRGQVIGGIAVGGNPRQLDEEVARAALHALEVED
jgi:uncharacterized protein GlcG (DUF336 family)